MFDGHAGKKAAEFCGLHFHEVRLSLFLCKSAGARARRRATQADPGNLASQYLLENMRKQSTTPIPHLLNATFHAVDTQLSSLSASEGSHSGSTAVTCLVRLEDEHGNPVGEASGVAPHVGSARGELVGKAGEAAREAQASGIDPTEGKPGSGEGQHPAGASARLSAVSDTLERSTTSARERLLVVRWR